MKKQILIAVVLLCGSLCMQATDVQSLVVQAKGGSESTCVLSGVRKITFSGSTMSVVKKDATQSDYTISNVQKLLFGLRTSAINEVSTGSLKAYPNPAKEVLNVDGISKVDNLHLYNLTGSELSVSYGLVNNGLQISTGDLSQGLYLLQVNNQTIKFQKR
ncbi:MAG: T9SS type A sorting domain-containing protein [Paludibacteraceae bacterium]|nr:T9SS type A sorting domain-containing protein [Paludibacteraceae bacterium]